MLPVLQRSVPIGCNAINRSALTHPRSSADGGRTPLQRVSANQAVGFRQPLTKSFLPMASSVLIVGGGVFGIASAWELARRGWTVTVLDSGTIPRDAAASTDISKIVRMDYGADLLYTEMAEAAMAGWDEWNRRWSPPAYHQDGFAVLTSEPMQAGGFEHESYRLLASRGHPVARLRDIDRRTVLAAWPE